VLSNTALSHLLSCPFFIRKKRTKPARLPSAGGNSCPKKLLRQTVFGPAIATLDVDHMAFRLYDKLKMTK